MASQTVTIRDEVYNILSAVNPSSDAAASPPTTLPRHVDLRKKWVAISSLSEIDEATGPVVCVIPRQRQMDLETRDASSDEVATSVSVRQRVKVNDAGEAEDAAAETVLDGLVELAEAIANVLGRQANQKLPTSGARWVRTEHTALWIQEHLVQHGIFTSVITVYHRQSRLRG